LLDSLRIKKNFSRRKKKKKNLLAVLAFLTLLTGCFKSENTNTVSTDGLTSMEKVIGILGEVFTENNKGFSGVLVY
jgi:phosphate transport system substrate-binding protein